MFKKIALFACFCLFINSAFTQGVWTQLSSNSVSHFEDIEFVSLNRGFTVGSDGTLLGTTDGGLVWDSIPLSLTSDLNAIDFPTAAMGFLVGENGAAMQSSDSGSTWSPMNLPATYHYHDVSFLNVNLGWVIGRDTNDAMLLKTTDGGQSWQSHREPGWVYSSPQGFGADYDFYEKILVTTEDDVYVGGFHYNYGGSSEYRAFVREFDIGLNVKPTGFNSNLGDMYAGVHGLATPNQGDILVMLNRGMPNSPLSSFGENWFIRPPGFSVYAPIGTSAHVFDNYYCLHFTDSTTAYVSRSTQGNGYGIYQTDGGGVNYTDLLYPDIDRILAIDFPAQGGGSVGYFAGYSGTIYKYEPAVSVANPRDPELFQVYPNPSEGKLNIQFSNGVTSGNLKLYDVTGRQVRGFAFQDRSTLDTEFIGLQAGVYMLSVETDKGKIYVKKVQVLSQ